MTHPAKRNNRHVIYQSNRRQIQVLGVLIVLSMGLDLLFFGDVQMLYAKSFTVGALLMVGTHRVFTWIAFYHNYKSGRQMAYQIYLAQMIKWLVTLIGFALIFLNMKSISTAWVLLGYLLMNLANFFVLSRTHHKSMTK